MQDNMKCDNIHIIVIQNREEDTKKKSLTNYGKTKKQAPNERKGGSLRNNAK